MSLWSDVNVVPIWRYPSHSRFSSTGAPTVAREPPAQPVGQWQWAARIVQKRNWDQLTPKSGSRIRSIDFPITDQIYEKESFFHPRVAVSLGGAPGENGTHIGKL